MSNIDPQLLAQAEAVPEVPSLADLISEAEQLWGAASMVRPDRFAGFRTSFDNTTGTASFATRRGIADADTFRISRDAEGAWTITSEADRPSLESQGLNKVVRTTQTFPLAPGGLVVTVACLGRTHSGGELSNRVYFGGGSPYPLNELACRELLDVLQIIRGEVKTPEPPKASGASRWLSGLVRTLIDPI